MNSEEIPIPEMNPEIYKRYMKAIHAIQSGVLEKMKIGTKEHTPKHLRVGINSVLCSNTAIVRLLVKKGIFTIDEYGEQLCLQVEAQKEIYEAFLSDYYDKPIKLL